jgi:Ca2+-binding EF-hand superfamily protein
MKNNLSLKVFDKNNDNKVDSKELSKLWNELR